MTTEAQEVTTMDELQLRFLYEELLKDLLPSGVYAERGRPMTTEAQEVTTWTSFNFALLEEEDLLKDL